MKSYWTTREGKRVPYSKLSDDHLKNIIRDGYRNPKIMEEAASRGFEVPARPVDQLTFEQHCMWVESFNSCAINGNAAAERMAKLHDENYGLYLLELNALLEVTKNSDES